MQPTHYANAIKGTLKGRTIICRDGRRDLPCLPRVYRLYKSNLRGGKKVWYVKELGILIWKGHLMMMLKLKEAELSREEVPSI